MPCSHCGGTGHNIQTCQAAGADEARTQRSDGRARRERARREVAERAQRAQRAIRENRFPNLHIYNNNPYCVSIYYCATDSTDRIYRHWIDVEEMGHMKINQDSPDTHLFFIPSSLCDFTHQQIRKSFSVDEINSLFIITDVLFGRNNVFQRPNNEIHLLREFKGNKTPIDQWKECSLKSLYLLDQLIKLGASHNDTYAVILDLVQDIPIPKHEELDRENAGVPSAFTNITNQTRINEPE
jgi:hypothetical protein